MQCPRCFFKINNVKTPPRANTERLTTIMSKKSKIFLAAVAVLTCLAGIASVFLVHYAEEREKADAAADAELAARLTMSVRRYEMTLPSLRFTEENPPAFADVLDYYAYEGFYSDESYKGAGEQTPDLLEECLVKDFTYKVPAETVETLLKARFGVAADRDSVSRDNASRSSNAYYDVDSGCYVFDARINVLHNVSISEREETKPGVYHLVICKDTAVTGYPAVPVYREYTLADGGEGFKFLSVTDHKTKGGSAEPDDRKLRQIIAAYATACDADFAMGDSVPYADVFNYFMYDGCIDINENALKPEMEKYLRADGSLSVPAAVADEFLAKRFRTTPDKTSVSCYNSDTDTYDFTPVYTDSTHYYNIVEKTNLGGGTYVIYAMQKAYGDATGFSGGFYRFVVQARRDDFKFLSASKLYDHSADKELYPVELEKNDNYSIVESSSMEFEYVIYAADGSEAERRSTGSTYPRVSSENGITSITVSGITKYYSLSAGKFSDNYTDVYAQNGTTIAFADVEQGKVTIYVTDVFDTPKLVVPFDREFSPENIERPSDCIVSMEFTEEGDLKVSYVKGEGYTLTDEVLEID